MFVSGSGLRQLSFEALSAGHVLKRIRELEERWIWLFRSRSDLLIFSEADLLRPLIEFFSSNWLLWGVLDRWVPQDTYDVNHHLPPGSIFKLLAGETACFDRVNVGAEKKTTLEIRRFRTKLQRPAGRGDSHIAKGV